MTSSQKNILELPFSSCPFCLEENRLLIDEGKKVLFLKKNDSIVCSECQSMFEVSDKESFVLAIELGSPYAYFSEILAKWRTPDGISSFTEMIRNNSPKVLDYLPGAKKYVWRVRIILDAGGEATSDSLELKISYENEPETKDEAKKELSRLIQAQKEIRQVKKEMAFDMKQIRAKYGRKQVNQAAKSQALSPYEQATLAIDSVLIFLDKCKLEIQNWVDDNL